MLICFLLSGSAGIGRQARLRILCMYLRVGSSPIFRSRTKVEQVKSTCSFFVLCRGVPLNTECYAFRGSRSPRHKCLVGRFDGKKVHWTFFLIRLTPSSAGEEIYNINKRSFKYGFTIATKIESTEKVSNYITKYITKELITMSKGQHRYLYSKNLAKP